MVFNMDKQIVYRAMCDDELADTIKNGKPSFHKRFKWFTKELDFVRERVQDGHFNNSNHVKNRYQHIAMFEADVSVAVSVSKKELQFDRRKNPNIKFLEVIT